ncbi:MAG: hypothetical protein NVSMB33_10300 [Ktedonobacteraceae bacterium]
MRNNPYSNDPINMQPTDVIPPMPDLPPKQVLQTPLINESVSHNHVEPEESIDIRPDEGHILKFVIGKIGDFLRWFAIVLEITLGLRFLFMLIGADPTNIFTNFLYALTKVILFPFNNIVPNPSFHPNQAFEITTLIGMGIYWLVFWLLGSFVRILISEPKEPVE